MSMSSSKFDWLLSSLTPNANESQVPSTAEIIQKCLSVNPFDLKFREANLQINGQGQSGADHHQQLLGSSGNLPTTSGLGSVLNLPPSLSSTHSPGIFSNINVLTADIEGEIRKTIDLSRKVQQLRENGLLCRQDDGQQLKTPCTSDVLNAVLDMSANNHQLGSGQSSPFISSSSLIAGLSGLKAALANSSSAASTNHHSHAADQTITSSNGHLVPTSSIPNFKLEPDLGGGGPNGGNMDGSSFTPVSAQGKTMSTPDLHLKQLNVTGFKQHSPVLPSEALLVFQQHQQAQAVSSSSMGATTLTVPSLNSGHSLSAQSSPNGSLRSAISPAQGLLSGGTSLAELTSADASPLKPDEGWKLAEPKPICPPQITIAQQSPYSDQMDFDESCKPSSEGGGQHQHHQKQSHNREKHRKYTKYSGSRWELPNQLLINSTAHSAVLTAK